MSTGGFWLGCTPSCSASDLIRTWCASYLPNICSVAASISGPKKSSSELGVGIAVEDFDLSGGAVGVGLLINACEIVPAHDPVGFQEPHNRAPERLVPLHHHVWRA